MRKGTVSKKDRSPEAAMINCRAKINKLIRTWSKERDIVRSSILDE